METISENRPDVEKEGISPIQITSYNMKCFAETPWKTGSQKPLTRIGAFDIFNLFTADIIRDKVIFTR